MKTLTDLLNSNELIKESDIPEKFRKSFNEFMYGQTCQFENGEFLHYHWDFSRWYYINEQEIKRFEKLNELGI